MQRTSGLQSFKVLYCGGTDWGRPSWKYPEPPEDQENKVRSRCIHLHDSWIQSVFLCLHEFFTEVGGVVHAELWQRPAEICLMFFPWRAVMSVGSFTGLECPRPSWNTQIHGSPQSASDSTTYFGLLRRDFSSWLPGPRCCSPRHRRPQWRTGQAHVHSPQQCPL